MQAQHAAGGSQTVTVTLEELQGRVAQQVQQQAATERAAFDQGTGGTRVDPTGGLQHQIGEVLNGRQIQARAVDRYTQHVLTQLPDTEQLFRDRYGENIQNQTAVLELFQNMRTHAEFYQGTIRPNLLQTVRTIYHYAIEVEQTYAEIVRLLDGAREVPTDARDALEALVERVEEHQQAAERLENQLNQFLDDCTNDQLALEVRAGQIAGQHVEVSNALRGMRENLAHLKEENTRVEARRNQLFNQMLGGGGRALAAGVGTLDALRGFRFVGQVAQTAGVQVNVPDPVGQGLQGAAAGLGAVMTGLEVYSLIIHHREYQQETRRREEIVEQITQTTTGIETHELTEAALIRLQTEIEELRRLLTDSLANTMLIRDAWSSIHSDLRAALQNTQQAQTAERVIQVRIKLGIAQRLWRGIAEQAGRFQIAE